MIKRAALWCFAAAAGAALGATALGEASASPTDERPRSWPAGMPLRTLGSLVDATDRRGTVLAFPVPIELLRLAGAGANDHR